MLEHGVGPTLIKAAKRYPEGLFRDDASGELCLHDRHGEGTKLANATKKKVSDQDALEMRERYLDKWGNRKFTQKIADAEAVSVRTIQRYIKKFPL
jgi:hypothetical protein